MILRPAREADFPHLETFVWQAIFPTFDHPMLTLVQRQENDRLVEHARAEVLLALEERNTAVFVALEPRTRSLAGYLIADGAPQAYAEIRRIIVKRSYWGKGVAANLLEEATNFIGRERAISLAVRHYNERALAFFAKHGFVNTGETTGNFAIPRTLLLREALEEIQPTVEEKSTPEMPKSQWEDDFPTGADEPVFESLPDYNLRVEESPLFTPGSNALARAKEEDFEGGETSLSNDQLTELEAFIARARAKKGVPAPLDRSDPVSSRKAAVQQSGTTAKPSAISPVVESPTFDRSKIAFEVDFGDGRMEPVAKDRAASPQLNSPTREGKRPGGSAKPSFEFAFSANGEPAAAAPKTPVTIHRAGISQQASGGKVSASPAKMAKKKTKHCPDCASILPAVARFCFSCGYPQPEEESEQPRGSKAPVETPLRLEELPDLKEENSNDAFNDFLKAPAKKPAPEASTLLQDKGNEQKSTTSKTYTLSDLKLAFRGHLQERLIAYFGDRKLKAFINRLEESTTFQALRDGSLTNLMNWLNAGATHAAAKRRLHNTLADLTEYFVVETAGDLSDGVLPQRLLRHQSIDWETADIFKVVMDYLDFDSETERVYTDFVAMPSRALRNATKAFLQAKRDERIYFICDQSLISQAKNGFSVTDAGLYWKNVLQPAGAVTFTTLERVKIEQGHLQLDGQFFNAGGRLNLKMAVLLDKLRRM